MTVSIRPISMDDAEACGVICYEAFRTIAEAHNFPPDFPSPDAGVGLMRMMIAHPRMYGVAAEADGRVIGSNFLWEQSSIAGVGPITIDPRAQNAGVGRALMQAVIERADGQGWAGVRLVQAAYHGRSLSLYTRLGFDPREPLAVLQGPAIGQPVPGCAVRPATDADAQACDALCRAVHGHDREGEVRDAIAQGSARVVERGGRLTGYATSIGFFGHAAGETNDDMKALIAETAGFAGPGLLMPMRNAELFRWCLEAGLRVVQPMTLMSRGPYQEPKGAFLPSILF
jgi:GNAT superfamily N-acetyltransferase